MSDSAAQQDIDDLMARFFRCFDNRDGATPTLAAIASCFTDKAVIVRRSQAGTDIYTVTEFALPRVKLLTDGALRDFHERETSATTHVLDGIATRTSRYSKAGLLDGQPYAGTGTKCFQLTRLGVAWRIVSIVWADDPA